MKTFKLPILLCFESVIFFIFFFSLHLLCLATPLENTVIHSSESPLVTSLKILLVIHLKHLQSFTTSFLRSEHLLIKHCHTVLREKAITENECKTRCDLAHGIRTISFPGKEKIWDSWSVSSSNYSRRWKLSVHIKQSRTQSLQQLGKLGWQMTFFPLRINGMFQWCLVWDISQNVNQALVQKQTNKQQNKQKITLNFLWMCNANKTAALPSPPLHQNYVEVLESIFIFSFSLL